MAKKESKKSKAPLVIGGLVILAIITILVLSSSKPSYDSEELKAFATCLTDNGAVMYGAFWCPHCAKTKKNFGESFRYISYVECDPRGEDEQAELCIEKQIDSYDTWEFNDDPNTRVIGEPSFEALASKTGCVVPEAK